MNPPLPPVGPGQPVDRPAIANKKVARGRKARYCQHLPSRFRASWSPSLLSSFVFYRVLHLRPLESLRVRTYVSTCISRLLVLLRFLLLLVVLVSLLLGIPFRSSFSFFYYALSESPLTDCLRSSSSSTGGAVSRGVCMRARFSRTSAFSCFLFSHLLSLSLSLQLITVCRASGD